MVVVDEEAAHGHGPSVPDAAVLGIAASRNACPPASLHAGWVLAAKTGTARGASMESGRSSQLPDVAGPSHRARLMSTRKLQRHHGSEAHMLRRRSRWQPDGGCPAAALCACRPSPASCAADCAVRGGSEDGHLRAESRRLPPARTDASARHRPAGDRRARQRSWQLRCLQVELAVSARPAGRVRARRVLNHHEPRGRHWTREPLPPSPWRNRCRPCAPGPGVLQRAARTGRGPVRSSR